MCRRQLLRPIISQQLSLQLMKRINTKTRTSPYGVMQLAQGMLKLHKLFVKGRLLKNLCGVVKV